MSTLKQVISGNPTIKHAAAEKTKAYRSPLRKSSDTTSGHSRHSASIQRIVPIILTISFRFMISYSKMSFRSCKNRDFATMTT